jgi:hypothetical protein
MKVRNYNQAHTFCIEDLRRELKKAIKPCSFSTTILQLGAVYLDVAGDTTTWDGEAGAYCTVVGGPPKWHHSLEVEEDHQALAGRSN